MNGRTSTEKAEHMRLLRTRAEDLRDQAEHMKSREARSTLMILAQSYDRMADELEKPERAELQDIPHHRSKA
jgi:hypothetical protein